MILIARSGRNFAVKLQNMPSFISIMIKRNGVDFA
jgi:hypothetical protein